MLCPRCGKENRATRAVCLSCGHQLNGSDGPDGSEGSRPAPVGTVRCNNCGSHVQNGARFCTSCGQLADENTECPECHSRVGIIDRYCPGCGRALRPAKVPRFSGKPVAALILGLIPGLLSLWGIGHIFAGRVDRGIVFFILGLVMSLVAPATILLVVRSIGGVVILYALGVVAWIVLWLYQSIDAYHVAGGD